MKISIDNPSGYRYKNKRQIEGFNMKEKHIENFLGAKSLMKLRHELNPQSKKRYKYIVLDSRERIVTSGNIQKFQWNYINNLSREEGSVNTYGNVKNIIHLRVFPVRIPYISYADTPLKRISLNIEELSPQGFIAHERRQFHFLFDNIVDGRWINLNPFNYNDGYYRFNPPITNLDSITVTFGSPLEPLSFDPDRAEYTMTYGALSTLVTTNITHNLFTGDIVYFNDFTTTDPSADSDKISEINNIHGHHITKKSDTSFTIPVNTIGVNPIPAGLIVNVYFGSKRIIIPLEITYLESYNPTDN